MKALNALLILSTSSTLLAQGLSVESLNQDPVRTESPDDTIYVLGSKEKAFYTPGSATFIDSKELKKFNYQDVGRVLDKVPGVYIQEEDGLGLRPNIGLRGAHPHRSKKITIMEDGILSGPAPYAAPAAYYFPSTSRLSTMEVFKGPSSVKYGPNSVGGALNIVTKEFSNKESEAEIELATGSLTQMRLTTSGTTKDYSYLAQFNRREGDLVSSLPNGEQPDFEQNDILLKFAKRFESYGQSLAMKLSFATEDSDETYLGMTATDFNNSPYTRYAASQDDNMKWERYGAQISYQVKPNSSLKINSTIYHHHLKRTWAKFNDLYFYQDFRGALNSGYDPDNLIALLKGERNSNDLNETIRYGANDRKYFSQGIQTEVGLSQTIGATDHEATIGLRIHRDQVQRNHNETLADMIDGDLVYREESYTITNKDQDTSNAIALYAQDEIFWGDLTATIGARFETVSHESNPRGLGSESIQTNDEQVFVPGVGINYSVTPNFVLLGGINKGVTLVGPGQNSSVKPEEALNYEVGFRIKAPIYLESIAFYSDYQNLKGTCSFSSGCSDELLDTEFNGGEGEIYGLETSASHQFNAGSFRIPFNFGHTFTVARFKSSLLNDNPEWGPTAENEDRLIRVNDPMPYVPQNQFNVGTGLGYKNFDWNVNFLWKSEMADQAVAAGRRTIPSYGVIDTSFSYRYSQGTNLFLRVKNLLDNTYLTSLRPFGARPGAPRTLFTGFTQTF